MAQRERSPGNEHTTFAVACECLELANCAVAFFDELAIDQSSLAPHEVLEFEQLRDDLRDSPKILNFRPEVFASALDSIVQDPTQAGRDFLHATITERAHAFGRELMLIQQTAGKLSGTRMAMLQAMARLGGGPVTTEAILSAARIGSDARRRTSDLADLSAAGFIRSVPGRYGGRTLTERGWLLATMGPTPKDF